MTQELPSFCDDCKLKPFCAADSSFQSLKREAIRNNLYRREIKEKFSGPKAIAINLDCPQFPIILENYHKLLESARRKSR